MSDPQDPPQELIGPSAVRLDAHAEDWREAVRLAGALLRDNGIAGESYTDAMIRVVEEHGPYIVITPGFALTHARPDDSVSRTGMSFVRLAEPVAFGHEANDPVRIVMGLAATGDGAHQSAMANLAGVLADPERRAALDTAEDPAQVLRALDAELPPTQRARGTTDPTAAPGTTATAGATTTGAAATTGTTGAAAARGTIDGPPPSDDATTTGPTVPSKNLILTVCGNGLGTSLFLKNTAEKVLDAWGWTPYLNVEATDTISAKGKAKDADLIFTSGAIAETLGDVGVPVHVIENFTSTDEIDGALRRLYDV